MHSLYIFDISAILMMVILAYLSRRLGEALKITAYYKLLHITSVAVFAAFAIDTLPDPVRTQSIETAAMAVRSAAGAVALLVTLRYWGWLFRDFFKH
jgi:hypothetical protein